MNALHVGNGRKQAGMSGWISVSVGTDSWALFSCVKNVGMVTMVRRKGMGKGMGKGYKNLVGKDKKVHSDSAKGRKQPQKIYTRPPFIKDGKLNTDAYFEDEKTGEVFLKDKYKKKEKKKSYPKCDLNHEREYDDNGEIFTRWVDDEEIVFCSGCGKPFRSLSTGGKLTDRDRKELGL